MNKKNIKTKINRQKYNHGSKKVMSGGNICALFGKQIDNSDNPLDLSESDFKIINKESNYNADMLEHSLKLVNAIKENKRIKIINQYRKNNPQKLNKNKITNNEILQTYVLSKIEKDRQLKKSKELYNDIVKLVDKIKTFDLKIRSLPELIQGLINLLEYKLVDNSLISERYIIYPPILVDNNAIIIQTSGNSNDCLIHSILTCVSDVFSRLSINHKNVIAHFFRRYILPEISLFTDNEKQILISEEFLEDNVLEKINEYYNINIISVVDTNDGLEHRTKIVNLYNLNLEHPNCFLIHNSRLIHFSAIYLYNQKQFKVPRFIILELIKHNTKIFSNNRNGIKAFDTNMMFYGFTVDAEKKDGKRYTKDGKRYDVDEAKTYVNSKL